MAEARAWVIIPKSRNKGTEVELDMRPLVLCKDCKYKEESVSPYWEAWCNRLHCGCDFNWFCADGERRENDG